MLQLAEVTITAWRISASTGSSAIADDIDDRPRGVLTWQLPGPHRQRCDVSPETAVDTGLVSPVADMIESALRRLFEVQPRRRVGNIGIYRQRRHRRRQPGLAPGAKSRESCPRDSRTRSSGLEVLACATLSPRVVPPRLRGATPSQTTAGARRLRRWLLPARAPSHQGWPPRPPRG